MFASRVILKYHESDDLTRVVEMELLPVKRDIKWQLNALDDDKASLSIPISLRFESDAVIVRNSVGLEILIVIEGIKLTQRWLIEWNSSKAETWLIETIHHYETWRMIAHNNFDRN